MSFRQLRKGIYSTKRASAKCGMPFARPNGLPPTAERHLLDQTGFRQQRKSICSTKCHLRYGNHPVFFLHRAFCSPRSAAYCTIFKNVSCENSFFLAKNLRLYIFYCIKQFKRKHLQKIVKPLTKENLIIALMLHSFISYTTP